MRRTLILSLFVALTCAVPASAQTYATPRGTVQSPHL